jgi:hypothetical protein
MPAVTCVYYMLGDDCSLESRLRLHLDALLYLSYDCESQKVEPKLPNITFTKVSDAMQLVVPGYEADCLVSL